MDDYYQFIGNSTQILCIDNTTFLIDPAFLHHPKKINLGWGLFSKRVKEAGLTLDDLPDIDVILLTHTHTDHWDGDYLLEKFRDTTIITNPKDEKKLRKQGFTNIVGIEVEESTKYNEITITATHAQHGPIWMNPFTGNVIGFSLENSERKIWVSGDTVTTSKLVTMLNEIKPDTGLVNFGGAKAFFIRLTYDGKDAIETIKQVDSLKTIYAVHVDDWSHFTTTEENIKSAFTSLENVDLIFPPRGKKISF